MKTQKNEGEQQDKLVTRYDRKLEKRKQEARKRAREDRIFKITSMAVGLLFIVAIVGLFAASTIKKNKAIKDVYVKVGSHEVNKLEYDYYYNMIKSNYLTTYSSILPYMGLDTDMDFALQQYSDTMTWKDAFDEMTINQLMNIKAMSDDAQANSFTADVNENYNEFINNMTANASASGKSEAQYYKENLGPYATRNNLEPFIRENLLVEAYYNSLVDKFSPSEEEITSYYEENKNNYDKITYRSFALNADAAAEATEEQIAEAMQQLKTKAEQMADRRKNGEDFKALCLEYAAEGDKETYQAADHDPSLTESASNSSVSANYRDWLFDESRKAAEVTVVEDEAAKICYVVEFVERIYDETANESIRLTLANGEVSEYASALAEQCEVVDVAGALDYLKISATVAETTAETTTVIEENNEETAEAATEAQNP